MTPYGMFISELIIHIYACVYKKNMYPSRDNSQQLQAGYESQLIVWFLSLLQ